MPLDFQDQVRFGYVEPDDEYTPNLRCHGSDAEGYECEGELALKPSFMRDVCDPATGAVMETQEIWVCPVCGWEHTADEVYG